MLLIYRMGLFRYHGIGAIAGGAQIRGGLLLLDGVVFYFCLILVHALCFYVWSLYLHSENSPSAGTLL